MKFFQNLLLLFSGLILALILSEVTVRLLDLAPEVLYIEKWRMRMSANPLIGYEPIPNLDSKGKSVQFFGYEGASNNMGFRDHDHPIKAPQNTKRIIALGDSVTAGLWIEKDEDTYPAKLEARLKSSNNNIEVLNFGVLGYNTAQEVETLIDKGLQFKPDLIILNYCLNDREDDSGGIMFHLNNLAAEDGSEKITPDMLHPALKQSALFRFIKFRVLPVLFSQEKRAPKQIDTKSLGADTVEASFKKLAQISKQENIPVLVVLFPEFDVMDKRTKEYLKLEEHSIIANLAIDNGFDFLDLLKPMEFCNNKNPNELVSFDLYHMRPYGAQCAADIISSSVKTMLE